MPRRKKLSNIEIYLVKRRLGLVPQRSYPSSRHTNPAEISSGEASDPSFSQDQFESEVPSEGGRSDQVEEAPFLLSTSIEKEEFIISWKTEPEKMLGDWQNWCRLCGKIDSDEPEAWYKAELLREQLEFVTEHFNISVEPYEDDQGHVQPLVCAECYNLLEILKSFERLCFKTDAMFKQLMRVKNFSESQLKALRWDHGVDKDKKFGECSAHLTARQSTSRNKRKRQEQQEISERDDKDSNKELFVVSYNEEKAYIVVPYEGPELEYDDFIRKACSYLKLEEISTIYDHKEIKIDAESFKFVLKKCPPEYFIIKSGNQSKASCSTSSKIQEDSEQCFSASEQYSDTAELEIGETLVMKQEAPEVETESTEPMLKVRRLELLQESETTEMLFEDQIMSHESPNLDHNYEDLTNEFSYLSNDESSSVSIQPNPNLKKGFGISLKEIMKCPEALGIMNYHRTHRALDRTRRDYLINLILNYADHHGIHLSCKILEALSKEIQEMFPSEIKENYYMPRNAVQKSYSGLLYARYHNRKRGVKKKQEIENNIAVMHNGDQEISMGPAVTYNHLKAILSDKQNENISSEIIETWLKCTILRRADFLKKEDGILEWPLLKNVQGYVLITGDFSVWFAQAKTLDFKWKEFHDNIIQVLRMYIKDRQSRQTLEDLIGSVTDEETKQCTVFLLLHSILKPRAFLRKPDPIDRTKIRYKPSFSDAQDSMLIMLESEDQLESRVEAFEKNLQETGRKFHPIIFRVKGGNYHVYCHRDIKYQIETLKQAIDICFKSFHVLYPGDYPVESEVVWYFIQTYFYDMKRTGDTRLMGSCVDIINDLDRAARAAHIKILQKA